MSSTESPPDAVYPAADLASALLPCWRLLSLEPLSRRVHHLRVKDRAGAKVSLILLRHSLRDRQRNPHIARDEFRLLQLLHATDLPVPRPLRLLDTLQPPALVTERVAGKSRYESANTNALCGALADILRRIHQCHIPRRQLDFLPDISESLLDCLRDSSADERIRQAMKGALPALRPNPPTLLHGDFWLGNLLWRGDELAAVIDWEDAMLGDPLADLGKSRLELLWTLGDAAMRRYTAAYLRCCPALDPSALPFWDLFGALRLAHYASFTDDKFGCRGCMRSTRASSMMPCEN